ncbi:MAG TPA: P-II family nitrogen regulator [Lachnospiraceae bacterium]|nr:P-II family nitrogen regulator [Lachnospiraceae bacterium]
MKEVMAMVRLNRVNATKEALAEAGFPAFTCRKVMGRGKKAIDANLVETVLSEGELPISPLGEYITEGSRLIPKRYFTVIVPDDEVEKAVNTIIEANCTGNPGDGKIFVVPVAESIRIRDGELQIDSESY